MQEREKDGGSECSRLDKNSRQVKKKYDNTRGPVKARVTVNPHPFQMTLDKATLTGNALPHPGKATRLQRRAR